MEVIRLSPLELRGFPVDGKMRRDSRIDAAAVLREGEAPNCAIPSLV